MCKRCGVVGHDLVDCINSSMPRDKQGNIIPVDPNDVFMHSRVDTRFYRLQATVMWQLTMTYLEVNDVLPHVPRVCKYFNEEVVWHKWSGPLLFKEMDIDDKRSNRTNSLTLLMKACAVLAPLSHVTTLISGGANINADDGNDRTPLNFASMRGHLAIVRALLEAKADPNPVGMIITSWSPLMFASANGHSDVVLELINNGANINKADNEGMTPLMAAVTWNHPNVISIFLKAGANRNIRNYRGQNVLDLARNHRNKTLLSLF
jgi:ankyrin repeat protein